MTLFIDTGAFIALLDQDDYLHEKAVSFFDECRVKGGKFNTTNYVVCETINFLRMKVSYAAAVAFRKNLAESELIKINWISPAVEAEAFSIFVKYSDKSFSFTDCTSFAVMDSLKIKKSFAFDRHFEQYGGFKRLPEIS